jgi:hypothetical protein
MVCGAAAIITGIWWIYPPAAMIAGGAAVIFAGYLTD